MTGEGVVYNYWYGSTDVIRLCVEYNRVNEYPCGLSWVGGSYMRGCLQMCGIRLQTSMCW